MNQGIFKFIYKMFYRNYTGESSALSAREFYDFKSLRERTIPDDSVVNNNQTKSSDILKSGLIDTKKLTFPDYLKVEGMPENIKDMYYKDIRIRIKSPK